MLMQWLEFNVGANVLKKGLASDDVSMASNDHTLAFTIKRLPYPPDSFKVADLKRAIKTVRREALAKQAEREEG